MRTVDEVVKLGSCSGCGGCAVASQGSIKMVLQKNRTYLPVVIRGNAPQSAHEACPFTTIPSRVTRQNLGLMKAGLAAQSHPLIGAHSMLGIGRISGNDVWESSSGGLTSWILTELLRTGQIDGVIHLGQGKGGGSNEIFSYHLSMSISEVLARRGTKYYASTIEDVFEELKTKSGRFAFVGVPCFVNSVDFLRHADPHFARKIAFTIGLVCGHLKSQVFAQALSWQLGFSPEETKTVNFRKKNKVGSPLDYIFESSNHSGLVRSRQSSKLLGANWGHSAFSLNACNSCTDLFAYTSDVTFGDAWLPEYANDPRGTNIVVSRNKVVDDIILKGSRSGQIEFSMTSTQKIIDSQKGGIQHRIDGYLIRNSSANPSDPQMDFDYKVSKPRPLRRLLILFRKHIQQVTVNSTELASIQKYLRWKFHFQFLRYIYKALDTVSKIRIFKKN